MCLTFPNVFLRMLLMSLPLSCSITVPAGTFTAKCHERHFWLSVKASFLGSAVQFNVEDSTGIHFLSSQRAAECGYTVVWNHHGDLVFRASYLACYVENRRDTEFRLQVWFVNRQSDGSVEAYPFKLHCSVTEPLSPREIVCEENYMEVSIQWYIPVEAEQFRMERVIFYRPGDAHPASQSVKEAEALGYHIVATDTRLLLRGAYSSPFFYMRKEQDIQMEAVDAIIVVQLEGASIPVEISMACTKNEAVVDGLHLLWSFPLAVSSLVHDLFRNGRIRMEVGGRMLSDCEMHESGYKATLKDLTMEIRIPSEANGAQIKSGVIKGQYVQSLSVELFYMHHWEDVIWLHTQHRSFRLLHTPYVPQTPTLINDTVSSTSMFSVTLGVFPADVSLQNITVGNDTMTWTKAQYQGLHLTQLLFTNGSHAYTLHVPFSHPLVTQKVISKHYRRHVLALTFDFFILPEEEHFSYSTDVVSDLKVPACLPEGRMVVVADTTRSIPPVLPNSTTLLDSSCTPVATDSTRALFNFSLDSCGTTMTVEGNFLLYENQIRYMQTFLPKEDPLIHVDSPYRLTLQCRYPLNNTRTLTLHPLRNATIHRPSLPWKQT
uniref:ZP domain-containing protein n=1 Tax=Pygocentrus nattereri TaxID=42514 RepID=A0A3B4EAE3_PYGNA